MLYNASDVPVFATGKLGTGNQTIFQGDGNIVQVNSQGVPVWSSMTNHPDANENSGRWAVIQDDANLVVYTANNVPLWSSQAHEAYKPWAMRDASWVGKQGFSRSGSRAVNLGVLGVGRFGIPLGIWTVDMYGTPRSAPRQLKVDRRKILYLADTFTRWQGFQGAQVTWSFYQGGDGDLGNRNRGASVYRRFAQVPSPDNQRVIRRQIPLDPGLIWHTGDVIVELAPLGDTARYAISALTP